jgi:DNA-binding MarR family transcriptional regulator
VPGETPSDEIDLATSVVLAGLAIADLIRDALVDQGVSELRFSQLFVFARLRQGPSSISDIATQMGFSHQAASVRVNELESAGLVRRIRNPQDGRSRLVELTDRGLEALEIGMDARAKLLEQVAERTSRAERAAAQKVVMALLEIAGGMESVRVRDLGFPKTS